MNHMAVKNHRYAKVIMPEAVLDILSSASEPMDNYQITQALVEGGFPFKTKFPVGTVTQCTIVMYRKGTIQTRKAKVAGRGQPLRSFWLTKAKALAAGV